MKTSELIGPALNWAVAKCEGIEADILTWLDTAYPSGCYHYSTDWSQAGPIIERENIALRESKGKWYAITSSDLGDGEGARWILYTFKNVPKTASKSRQCRFSGPTPLVAAMRCYVASKLDDEVEIPEELK